MKAEREIVERDYDVKDSWTDEDSRMVKQDLRSNAHEEWHKNFRCEMLRREYADVFAAGSK